ncbi:hypothetical protein CO046_00220 [Candidatus Peregrinibacteria bacterium CG_4_9_14_0_2_um_filter_53_11]|nr:MAG: hypothetical protein CO046_00220 [Candidatus Peregrinibacteria bacterium CG_4_9_14_0_2_um_filter_53_11]
MHLLRNIYGRPELEKKLEVEAVERTTISFYRYVPLTDPEALRDELYKEWTELGVLGRIYLATEGVNAQFSLPTENIEAFRANLESRAEFKEMPFKIGLIGGPSFVKLTLKVRKQIVADGLEEGSYDISNVGNHLTPEEFNRAMDEDDAIVVDMRNHYESRVGHFEGALCPDADTFREELPLVSEELKGKEDKKILLYCTGGIRCEKASSYLKSQGFRNVNQLYGGIINYAREAQEKGFEPRFKGKNFVFDGRLTEPVTADVLSECDQCGGKSDRVTNCKNEICNLLFIQCEACAEQMSETCTDLCKEVAALPIEERRELRRKAGKTDFKRFKSRQRPALRRSQPVS